MFLCDPEGYLGCPVSCLLLLPGVAASGPGDQRGAFLCRGELGLGWDVWPADQGVGCPLLGSGEEGEPLLGNVTKGFLQFIRGALCREGTSSWGSAFLFPWFLVATEVDLWFPIQRRI